MDGREDLAAQFARITRRLADLETPVLERRGLTMWEYVILSHLDEAPVETQLELAQKIGYDKTRLIALLDGLEERGLLTRTRAAADRRARIVELTRAGRTVTASARRDIHRMEDDLLSNAQRRSLQRLLDAL